MVFLYGKGSWGFQVRRAQKLSSYILYIHVSATNNLLFLESIFYIYKKNYITLNQAL